MLGGTPAGTPPRDEGWVPEFFLLVGAPAAVKPPDPPREGEGAGRIFLPKAAAAMPPPRLKGAWETPPPDDDDDWAGRLFLVVVPAPPRPDRGEA